jgi:hypothetical protein
MRNLSRTLLAVNTGYRRERDLPVTSESIISNAVFSLIDLVLITWVAREAVSRLRAGPVRFRLEIASMPDRGRGKRTTVAFLFLLSLALYLAVMEIISPSLLESPRNLIPWLWVMLFLNSSVLPRRDEKRWLVFASGLIGLVAGAVLLAAGLRILRFADLSVHLWTRSLMIVFSVILFAWGAAVLQESLSGTRVRERAIEVLGTTWLWSRIVVKDWQAREGGFALQLSILSPQGFFDMPIMAGKEVIVPVPASERPALEAFLAGHTATTG